MKNHVWEVGVERDGRFIEIVARMLTFVHWKGIQDVHTGIHTDVHTGIQDVHTLERHTRRTHIVLPRSCIKHDAAEICSSAPAHKHTHTRIYTQTYYNCARMQIHTKHLA